jgi:hypothetical protein
MAENTKQFQWIVTIKENLDALLPNAFVAGDLFWYPLEGNNLIRQAPAVRGGGILCVGPGRQRTGRLAA